MSIWVGFAWMAVWYVHDESSDDECVEHMPCLSFVVARRAAINIVDKLVSGESEHTQSQVLFDHYGEVEGDTDNSSDITEMQLSPDPWEYSVAATLSGYTGLLQQHDATDLGDLDFDPTDYGSGLDEGTLLDESVMEPQETLPDTGTVQDIGECNLPETALDMDTPQAPWANETGNAKGAIAVFVHMPWGGEGRAETVGR